MKKIVFSIILVILLGVIFVYRENIYNIYRTYILNEKSQDIELEEKNDYFRNESFDYVQLTDDFTPENFNELKNIYYTVLNSGQEEFTFYCPDEYTNCLDDVETIANDQTMLSNINNFVHPFNSFQNIETSYDSYGKITITIEHNYSDNDIKLISAKVDQIEQQIWNNTMTTDSKLRAAHDYIINNTKYDSARTDKQIIQYQSDTAYGSLLEGYAICGGYTDAMALFLEDLQLENYKISSANHVWNAVNINGTWYHLDLTWDDPITNTGENLLKYDFYLITTDRLLLIEQTEHNFDQSVYQEVV